MYKMELNVCVLYTTHPKTVKSSEIKYVGVNGPQLNKYRMSGTTFAVPQTIRLHDL